MVKASRVYVCHTFYHAYIACVKELLLRRGITEVGGRPIASMKKQPGKAASAESDTTSSATKADLILSTMSNDFRTLSGRLAAGGLFGRVLSFAETRGEEDASLQAMCVDRGSLIANLYRRIRYTRALGELQESRVPADFAGYDDVYVFCDSDPIGYYLNLRRIRYHALEDGLNSGKLDNQARLSNMGAWPVKRLMAKLGLIFIECGYSRYCVDFEVNDLAANVLSSPNTFAVPRRALWEALAPEDHAFLADMFLPDADALRQQMAAKKRPCVMILTEPLCTPAVRERMFTELTERYVGNYDVIIKPHPRDAVDYAALFADRAPAVSVLQGRFPMEVLDDLPDFCMEKLVSVITQVDDVRFAKERVYLGLSFLDRYEEPALHRRMEKLTGRPIEEPMTTRWTDIGETSHEQNMAGAAGLADISVRPANAGDSDWWLAVRNDEVTRRNSLTTVEIPPEVHVHWFAKKLADPAERMLVLEQGTERVGQLRLSPGETAGEIIISYAVAPEARGRGFGRRILETAAALAEKEFPGSLLVGEVRAENAVSRHLFEALGFEKTDAALPEVIRYERRV